MTPSPQDAGPAGVLAESCWLHLPRTGRCVDEWLPSAGYMDLSDYTDTAVAGAVGQKCSRRGKRGRRRKA